MPAIPKASLMPTTVKPRHFVNFVIGSISGAGAGLLVYAITDISLINLVAFGLVMAILTIFSAYHQDYLSHTSSEYIESLASYDLSELIKLSISPELNDYERKLIVKFLNENHSGWSLV